jgi:hypothetical protein
VRDHARRIKLRHPRRIALHEQHIVDGEVGFEVTFIALAGRDRLGDGR